MTSEERLTKLEEDIQEASAKKKDKWDKMSAIGSILIPISVAIVGWQMKKAD